MEVSPPYVGGLSSTWSIRRLNQLNEVQETEIGDSISLPRLVVCGDASSGKSSVLERLTGIAFTQIGSCGNKFPIEVVLRHTKKEQRITASIQPHNGRRPVSGDEFRRYHRNLSDISELPAIVKEVSSIISTRGSWNPKLGNNFTVDVLRIEITAYCGLHLTVIDLPGFITVNNGKFDDDDVRFAKELVESYLSNPHTIILAVLQASHDITNQTIIKLAQKHDQEGLRTLGVITKIDQANQGSEREIAKIAKNVGSVKLKHGFFLLKNPIISEIGGRLSPEAQSQEETEFFSEAVWKKQHLYLHRVGIENLKLFVRNLLEERLEDELPKIWQEIKEKLADIEGELELFGDERSIADEIRSFLTGVSMRFSHLARIAIAGDYHGACTDFFSERENQLRMRVHLANIEFSGTMRKNGQKRKLKTIYGGENPQDGSTTTGKDVGQLLVTEEQMIQWVKSVSLYQTTLVPDLS